MNSKLDDDYFVWLYANIGSVKSRNPARMHWNLARQLYTKEFVWFIANDDNRAADGVELRKEFVREHELEPEPEWLRYGCSMLEMLIALSRRLSFQAEGEPRAWFWELVENMGVDMAQSSDQQYNEEMRKKVDKAMEKVIWRIYSPMGRGGLFPLSETKKDQRKVELWYQMSEYIIADF